MIRVVTLIAAVSVAAVAISSLWWPRYHDTALLEYSGWLIGRGARPYVDVFEINLPGTLLFHVLGLRLLGNSDLSLRLRDLAVLAVALLAVRRIMRPFGSWAALVAIVLIGARYLAYGGATQSVQRDWLVAVLAIVVAALVLGPGGRLRMLAAGAVAGYAVTIKPQALLLVVMVPVLVVLAADGVTARDRIGAWRDRIADLVVTLVGAGVVIAGVALWLVRSGGWHEFWWSFFHYLPSYGRLDSSGIPEPSTLSSLVHSVRDTLLRPDLVLLCAGLGVLLTLVHPESQRRVLAVLAGMIGFGVVHAVFGTKIWDYHYWPFTVPGLLVVVASLHDVRRDAPEIGSRHARSFATAYVVVWAVVAAWLVVEGLRAVLLHAHGQLVAAPQQVWSLTIGLPLLVISARVLRPGIFDRSSRRTRRLAEVSVLAPLAVVAGLSATVAIDAAGATPIGVRPAYDRAVVDRTRALARQLRSRVRPGDTVQVIGTTDGAQAAALDVGVPSASRIVYDFTIFADPADPATQRLRSEMMRDLRRTRPRFFAVARDPWGPRDSYRDLGRFPELARYLRDYRVVWQDSDLRLYERR